MDFGDIKIDLRSCNRWIKKRFPNKDIITLEEFIGDYEDLIEQVKENWDFKRIENYVWEKYGKKIVFPEYNGNLEDMVEINHQLISWGHHLDEVLEDIVNEERDYLAEVLEDGKDIEFGRD